jgi:hypothetical protein
MKREILTLAMVILSMIAMLLVACSEPAPITPTDQQPIEIISVLGPLPPINPGGPVVEITLKNVSDEPIISLTATLELSRSFVFNFDVTPSNPLLPNKTISAKLSLIGGGFSDSLLYPLAINGTMQNGATFVYTKQVMIKQQMLNNLEISLAPIHEVRVSIMKSFPTQIGVYIQGGLRDGCTTFHDIEITQEGSTVNIKVTTQHPREVSCPAVYGYFEKNVNLGSDFIFGTTYTLKVNDYTTTFDGTLIKGEGFAIYLTKEDIPPDKMEILSHVDIADQPIISIQDIITYNAQTHEIKLTDEAFERISNLEVPVRGKSFLVCVDGAPIYWGAFWTPISSMSFDGVTIWKPLGNQESKLITLELGYPTSSFYEGEDPRNNASVLHSLEQSGKLINKLSITSIEKLPRSFKGYELYSWEEDSQWHFTLITGTDRIKTMEEITSKEDFISETGWVKIHVMGTDAIKYVLSHLPDGESVFWCDELHIGQTTGTDLQLPPEQITGAIEEYAKQCGLDFAVTVRSY